MIAMIEAAFATPTVPLAGGADGCTARGRAARERTVRVAAITRRADREEAIAASTDLLTKRRVHDVGAAARFDWTRRINRGTRETTGSVRRSIEAVAEGLKLLPSGLHPTSPPTRQPTAVQCFEGALGGSCSPCARVIATAAERLHGSSLNARHEQPWIPDSVDIGPDFRGSS
jgi:hypothetical protein